MGFSPNPRNSYLLTRFGGIGDSVILTVVARELKFRNPKVKVDFCVPEHQRQLFDNLSIFDNVFPTRRFGPTPLDCIPCEDGWVSIESIKPNYDVVIDYKFSIEGNGQYQGLAQKQGTFMITQNSNYQNWIDLSLAWADIDPTTVLGGKTPVYKIEPSEVEWAKKILNLKAGTRLIGIQLTASSLARTWYAQTQLPSLIFRKDPEACILAYQNDISWVLLTKYGPKRIDLDKEKALRQSAALVNEMDYFISADSGFSHIAEALGIKKIILYTTVPAWTRTKYYKNTKFIETAGKLECSPCFMIHRYCPVNMKRAEESLTDREKQVMNLNKQNAPIMQAASILATTPDGLNQEFSAVQSKLHGLSNIVPDCIASITPQMIMDKLDEFYIEDKCEAV